MGVRNIYYCDKCKLEDENIVSLKIRVTLSYKHGSPNYVDHSFDLCPSCSATERAVLKNAILDIGQPKSEGQAEYKSPLTNGEAHLASCLLELASDKFGNHGCSDFDLTDTGVPGTGMDNLYQRKRLILGMERHCGSEEEALEIEREEDALGEDGYKMTNDWVLMSYLSDRILGNT